MTVRCACACKTSIAGERAVSLPDASIRVRSRSVTRCSSRLQVSRHRVESFESWPEKPKSKRARGRVSWILRRSGRCISSAATSSAMKTRVQTVPARSTSTLFWLDETGPDVDERFRIQFGPTEGRVWIEAIERVVDTESLAQSTSGTVAQYSVLEARLRSTAPLPLDCERASRAFARIARRCGWRRSRASRAQRGLPTSIRNSIWSRGTSVRCATVTRVPSSG